jgi:FkbM family methyltransferase
MKFFLVLNKISLFFLNKSSSSLKYPIETGEYEALLYALKNITRKEKIILFDVGGNLGSYTNMAVIAFEKMKVDYQIFIFEPSKAAFKQLNESFKDNQNIEITNKAVSNMDGEAKLFGQWDGAAGSSLSEEALFLQNKDSSVQISQNIKTISLDSLMLEKKIDFLKIDVEGYELQVIQGSKQLILDKKIKFIQIEIGAASISTKQFLFDFWKILSKDYHFYFILKKGLYKIEEYEPYLENFYGASNFLLELKNK